MKEANYSSQYFKIAACLVFFTLFISGVIESIQYKSDIWSAGDWLINYQDGFIRRGFIGSVIYFASTNFGGYTLLYIVAFKILCYAIIAVALIFLTIKNKIGSVELLLLLSPWALSFAINDHSAGGRKELVFFALFFSYTTMVEQKFLSINLQKVILAFSLPVMTLMHEGLTFFYPIFFVFYRLLGFSIPTILNIILPAFFLVAIAFVASIIFHGDNEAADVICRSLQAQGLDGSICAGAIYALGQGPRTVTVQQLLFYSVLLLFSAIPLVWYATKNFVSMNSAICNILFLIVLSLPLYILAVDWGRWIHVTLTTFLISLIVTNKCFFKFNLTLKNNFILLPLVWFYIFNWRIPHCCVKNKFFQSSNISYYLKGLLFF